MSFRTDKQTLEDLMLFGRSNSRSVFEIFNHTHSRGGDAGDGRYVPESLVR